MRCEAKAKRCQKRASFRVSDGAQTLKLCREHKDWAIAETPSIFVERLRAKATP